MSWQATKCPQADSNCRPCLRRVNRGALRVGNAPTSAYLLGSRVTADAPHDRAHASVVAILLPRAYASPRARRYGSIKLCIRGGPFDPASYRCCRGMARSRSRRKIADSAVSRRRSCCGEHGYGGGAGVARMDQRGGGSASSSRSFDPAQGSLATRFFLSWSAAPTSQSLRGSFSPSRAGARSSSAMRGELLHRVWSQWWSVACGRSR